MENKAKLYQIMPEPLSLMECYVIKTANDRIVVIDGGIDGYGLNNPTYLPSAIRAILGIGQNDYFEIDSWFLSHGHTDHITELAKMLCEYGEGSNYKINNIVFSFPPFHNGWESRSGPRDYSDEAIEKLKAGMANYAEVNHLENFSYDKLNGCTLDGRKVEAGLHIEVDGVDFEILQVWAQDDLSLNSTSMVFRADFGGRTALFLGDAYIDTGDRLLARYGGDYLRSDYVQLAHHGQHGTSKEFYLAIGTDKSVRLWPSPNWVWGVYHSEHNIVCDETRSWFALPENPEEYFAGGYDKTGMDIVASQCAKYPDDPTKVECWRRDILDSMLVAEL